jgi:hypothetical protein
MANFKRPYYLYRKATLPSKKLVSSFVNTNPKGCELNKGQLSCTLRSKYYCKLLYYTIGE